MLAEEGVSRETSKQRAGRASAGIIARPDVGTCYSACMETMEQQIEAGAADLGVRLTPENVAALVHHASLVLEANKTMSLTTIPRDQFAGSHVLDSLAALPYLALAPEGAFADIGSGAGYPGIPLAIVSCRDAHLVESVRKKAAFLEAAVAALRLKATIHPVRAEELALTHGSHFAAVVAWALSALPSLVELASPLLIEGGRLICLKGAPEESEIARGDKAARRCGMNRIACEEVRVPFVDGKRVMIVYEKCGKPSLKLPRRPGMAQRQPLA